jgi:hypothetical protein
VIRQVLEVRHAKSVTYFKNQPFPLRFITFGYNFLDRNHIFPAEEFKYLAELFVIHGEIFLKGRRDLPSLRSILEKAWYEKSPPYAGTGPRSSGIERFKCRTSPGI